jgi:hypothetical protein
MNICPRCKGPIPTDAQRITGNMVYCPHCDATLIETGDGWDELEPTLPPDEE